MYGLSRNDNCGGGLPWAVSSFRKNSLRELAALLEPLLDDSEQSLGVEQALGRILLKWPDIRRVVEVPAFALARHSGLSEGQASTLLSLMKIALSLLRVPGGLPKIVSSPEDALPYLRGLRISRVERFWVIALDVRARCLGVREIAQGTLAGCSVAIRDIFSFLLDHDGHRGIVAHNHPGGLAYPSPEDLEFTREIVKVGKSLGVPLVDHLVVTQEDFISLARMGVMS